MMMSLGPASVCLREHVDPPVSLPWPRAGASSEGESNDCRAACNPEDLPQGLRSLRRRKMLEHVHGDDRVERPVSEREGRRSRPDRTQESRRVVAPTNGRGEVEVDTDDLPTKEPG